MQDSKYFNTPLLYFFKHTHQSLILIRINRGSKVTIIIDKKRDHDMETSSH